MKYFFSITTLALTVLFLSSPVVAHGQTGNADNSEPDLAYGSLLEQRGDEVSLRYSIPSGNKYFTCSLSNWMCGDPQDEEPTVFPEIKGELNYTTSRDGSLAVVEQSVTAGNLNRSFYSVYDISSDEPAFVTLLPHRESSENIYVTRDNQAVVFINDRSVTRVDIETLSSNNLMLDNTPHYLNLSPDGRQLSYYDYTQGSQIVRNLEIGDFNSFNSELAYFGEFSPDEDFYFLNTSDNYKRLYGVNLSEPILIPEAISADTATVEDFMVVENTLFYLANEDTGNPFDWQLIGVDNETDEKTVADQDASYGDFLKPINTTSGELLYYLDIEDRKRTPTFYDPTTNETHQLDPWSELPLSDELSLQTVNYTANLTAADESTIDELWGVLIEPDQEPDTGKQNLFVWLHGGPHRQVDDNYHSYTSYAVYDELLDRVASGGNTVLKLDYPGSYGYGEDFKLSIQDRLGVIDVAGVIAAVDELTSDQEFENVYLIGNSYGGYLSLKTMVEHPDRFTGAIGINGVYDWARLTSGLQTPFEKWFGGDLNLENKALYDQASITDKVENLTDSDQIMLVLGEADDNIPPAQTEGIYDFLQSEDINVDLVGYENEGHILRERENLDDLCREISNAFDLNNVFCGESEIDEDTEDESEPEDEGNSGESDDEKKMLTRENDDSSDTTPGGVMVR